MSRHIVPQSASLSERRRARENAQTTNTNNTNENTIILYDDAVLYDETIIIMPFFPARRCLRPNVLSPGLRDRFVVFCFLARW